MTIGVENTCWITLEYDHVTSNKLTLTFFASGFCEEMDDLVLMLYRRSSFQWSMPEMVS